MSPPIERRRPAELGIRIGRLPSGPTDSIVDVPNVRVGHATVWRDEPSPPDGRGVARTGVTAIVPYGVGDLFRSRVPAGAAVLNGAGEAIGMTAIEEWGVLESPILLTSSMAIGRVYDAAVSILVPTDPAIGDDDPIMPVVAECDDGWLNASRVVQVEPRDVLAAIRMAAGPEAGPPGGGAIGAGTGMVGFECKGGIGTASRLVSPMDLRESHLERQPDWTYTVGVVALVNFGRIERLTVAGVPVGETLVAEGWPDAGVEAPVGVGGIGLDDGSDGRSTGGYGTGGGGGRERGSCIVVVATDAPLLSPALTRLARRAGLGLARVGSTGGHASGEIFLAFSTGLRVPRGAPEALRTVSHVDDEYLDPLFAAVVDATEAATLDALFRADTVTGRDGHTVPGLPVERVLALLSAAGRLAG